MKYETLFSKIAVTVMVTVALMFIGNRPSEGADNEKIPAKLQPVGIINPDGGKRVWLVPDDISTLLGRYSSKKIEGFKFYQLTSWKDTATFLVAVNQHQEQIIGDLALDMQKIAKRVGRLERTRASVTTGSSEPTDPVIRDLEKKHKKTREMWEAGNL